MRRKRRRARLLGLLTAIGGMLLVVSTLPIVRSRFERVTNVFTPFGIDVASNVIAVAVGFALLYLAGQLVRRRRLAWILGVVLFGASAIVNILRVHHGYAAVYSVLMVVLLALSREQFTAPGDPPTLFEFLRFVPWCALGVVAYGSSALYLERGNIEPQLTIGGAARTILFGLIGVDGPYTYSRSGFEWFFPVSLLFMGLSGLAWALFLLFRPIIARPEEGRASWHEASEILRRHGRDSLDHFALRDDKLFYFASDGRAFIAYTFLGRHALVSGDPIGDPASCVTAIDEFLDMCAERAWAVAFLAVRESDRQIYLDRGLHTLYLGDEAIVHCRNFSLDGKRWKSIRQSSGRVARTYRFVWMAETDAGPELIDHLNAISRKWRGKAPERGFTMTLSQDIEGTNPAFMLCIAMDEHDRPGGFLRIVPIHGADSGFTLDVMRRDPDTPNGMTEFLLTRTMMQMDSMGLDRLSMNFAAWGRFFEDDVEYSWPQRAAKLLLNALSPFYQIRSLKEFNQRFHPEWIPRCIVYDDLRSLPRVALLYSGVEGFLNIPFVGRFLLPRTVSHPGHPINDET